MQCTVIFKGEVHFKWNVLYTPLNAVLVYPSLSPSRSPHYVLYTAFGQPFHCFVLCKIRCTFHGFVFHSRVTTRITYHFPRASTRKGCSQPFPPSFRYYSPFSGDSKDRKISNIPPCGCAKRCEQDPKCLWLGELDLARLGVGRTKLKA